MPTKAIGFVGGLVLANSLLIGMALFWGSTNDRYSAVMIIFIMLSMFVILASVGSQLDRLNNPQKWLESLLTNLQKRKTRLTASAEWDIISQSVEAELARLEQEARDIQNWIEAGRKALPPTPPMTPKFTKDN
jgi:uncharacterized membrane protein YjdF